MLPKIELHLHLDCSLSYPVASRLRSRLTQAQFDEEFIAPPRCNNLLDYIGRAKAGITLMQSAEQLRAVTLDVFQQLRDDGVIYAEIRFAPLLHLEHGLQPHQVVQTIDAATERGIRETRVEARIILCTLRHFTETQSMATVRLAGDFAGSRVVGFDIAGDEAGYPINAHRAAFRYAGERGIPCTAHAGEACGAESVWETLRELKPSRIGHGVRSVEDVALVEHLRKERIHLEVCPSSNVQTGATSSLAKHPVNRLYRSGVSISINCDGRTISQTSLEREYAQIQERFGWGTAELLDCNLEAVRAAFIPEDLKQRLARRLTTAYAGSAGGA